MTNPAAKASGPARRFALYVRVSDKKQLEGREYHSLESQTDFLVKWVADRDGSVFRVYEDRVSGTKLEERKGLMALLSDAQLGKFDEAVAYNLDRWSRDVEIHILLERIARETSVCFSSATQTFESTAEGELLKGQLAYINQYYSRVISAKVKLKRRLKLERGEWSGGPRPFGYTSEKGRLVVVPAEADVVRQMFVLFIEHPSAMRVRDRLRALGLKSRKGKPWSNSAIEKMLRNPIYAGDLRASADDDAKVLPGTHEPIVSKEVWEVASKLQPTRRKVRSTNDRGFPLLGIVWCEACGKAMTTSWVTKPHSRTGRIYYYRCTTTSKIAWHDCPVKQLNADWLEDRVLGEIGGLASDETLLTKVLAEANEQESAALAPVRAQLMTIERRIGEVEGRIAKFVEAVAAGGADASRSIRSALALEERNLDALQAERATLRAEVERGGGEPLDPDAVKTTLNDFGLMYDVASPQERSELLRLMLSRVEVRGREDVTLRFYSDVRLSDVNAPRTGSILRALKLPNLDSNQGHGD